MPIDWAEDENGDILFENGDLVRAESSAKHLKDLFKTHLGGLKQHGDTGIGISDYIEDDDFGAAYPKIQKQVTNDGATINKLELYENGGINLSADYDD